MLTARAVCCVAQRAGGPKREERAPSGEKLAPKRKGKGRRKGKPRKASLRKQEL